jgi:rhodanese-related sulfurtransferase
MSTVTARPAAFSFVTETPPADPAAAYRHFAAKLSLETDPWDLNADLERGNPRLRVIDARSAEHFALCHVPGAISLPHRSISEQTTADFPSDAVLVVYCWGPACNAAAKAAMRLSALGFAVKELIGGLEYWRTEGYPVEGSLGSDAPLHG